MEELKYIDYYSGNVKLGTICTKVTTSNLSSKDEIKNKFDVLNDGIYEDLGSNTAKLILPREVFIEAYLKYCKDM